MIIDDLGKIEQNISSLLTLIEPQTFSREGLQDTPRRVANSMAFQFSGYDRKVEDILTTFDSERYDEVVMLKDIAFYSHCEHHLEPFFGRAHVAYIPNGHIVGISKLARVVDIYARRLQNQERLTNQIAEALETHLKPQGVMVVLEGKHFCMMARGVQQQETTMVTSSIRGLFKEPNNLVRTEFLELIKK